MMTGSLRLPNQWQTCVLGDLLQAIQTGKSVRCVERPPTAKEKGLVKISAVTRGEFDENESKTLLTFDHLLPSQKIELGDLLFSRANTLELVGACAMVSDINKELYLSDKVLRLAMDSSFKPLVLRYLKTREARTQIEGLATGNQLSMRNISQEAIRAIELPFPPLAEQKVIADKLDTLLAQVENTKARLERIPQILKRFRQSVLAAAMSGRLTEEWRTEVDHSEWSDTPLDHICNSISDGDHQAPPRAQTGIPFLVISNVTGGDINFKNVSRWVPETYYNSLKSIRKPERGDLLYTVTGSFGIPVVIKTDQSFCFQRHIAIIKPNHDVVSTRYLALYLQSPKAFAHAASVATGTAQKTVSLNNLRKFSISLPTMEEQTEIVRRVDQLFAHADRIEHQINNALARVNNLTQSILAKAFRGELTEQWRKDNPELISGENSAAALLERIKAKRAAVKPAKGSRRKSNA